MMNLRKDINSPYSWVFEGNPSEIRRKKFVFKVKKCINDHKRVLYLLLVLLAAANTILLYLPKTMISYGAICIITVVLLSIVINDASKRLFYNVKQYIPMIIIPVAACITIIATTKLLSAGDEMVSKEGMLSFLGDYLSFCGTFCLGYFIYIQDRKQRLEQKRTAIKKLLVLIEKIQMDYIKLLRNADTNDRDEKDFCLISYDAEWMSNYYEYESLKGSNHELRHSLQQFFDNVVNVNASIKKGNIKEACEKHEKYLKARNYSIQRYNDLEAFSCLMDACMDINMNTKTWIDDPNTVDLINKLCREYYLIIENYIYVALLRSEKGILSDITDEVVDWLIHNSQKISSIIRFDDDKRIISRVVVDCSLKFEKHSTKISYIWGEYSLKEIEK